MDKADGQLDEKGMDGWMERIGCMDRRWLGG